MSISLRRVRSLNLLHNFQISTRNGGSNLKREYCFGIPNTNQHCPSLLTIERQREPSRNYFKQKNEVAKRIQWQRPVKVRSILPEKSGDLSGEAEVDFNQPPPLFKESSEYQTANDLVKRVLSLNFQSATLRKQAKFDAMTQKVKRHQYDDKSVEVKIAKWTGIIRNMQRHTAAFPSDRKTKADLKEIIEFRKKRMKLLRTLDYPRFEWLLENLDLLFKPAPRAHERVERKKSMKWLAAQYTENIKQKRLEEYKEVLESKKLGFVQSKLNTMKGIVEEEKSVGVEPSFTAEEIAETEEQLRILTIREQEKAAKQEVVVESY